MRISKVVPVNRRFGTTSKRIFLEHLAETANVTASAKKAGVSVSTAYVLRRKNEQFKGCWLDALSEGYANLEAQLLADALEEARGEIPDNILKERAQKHRLALALLAAHRASVKQRSGERADMQGEVTNNEGGEASNMRDELISRLDIMRERAERHSA